MARKPAPRNECKLHCCTTPPEAIAKIREDIANWSAGEYAQQVAPGPTCSCNVRGNKVGCYKHPHFGPKDEPFDMRT